MRISKEIFPRPVALVATVNKDGKANVATFSFIMPISFEPKFVAFAVAPQRYTFENLKEVGEFSLNILKKEQLEIANICGSYSGRDKDKFELAKLTKEEGEKISAPLIKEAPISLECRVVFMEKFGDHYLVVGEVLREVVREEKFDPLLHYSGDEFFTWKRL